MIPRSTGAKDISDYYHMYGRKGTQEFITNYIKKLKKNEKVD